MEKIIQVSGLVKSYGEVQAVKGIDFYVQKGWLFAFLGPNGAGKSTTIDIICTLLRPDSGTVTVNGHTVGKDDNAIRRDIGVVFQDSVLDKKLTVKENLQLRGSFYGLTGAKLAAAVDYATEISGCGDFLTRAYGKLSGGQRRRADIARTFLNMPKILFLDEPTTGLDPHTRQSVWETVKNISQTTGMTVFLTTHYMEEAANADYVAVIDGGKITARGAPWEIREKYSTDALYIQPKDKVLLQKKLDAAGIAYSQKTDTLVVPLSNTLDGIEIAARFKPDIAMLEIKSGSMDDAFINITGGVS